MGAGARLRRKRWGRAHPNNVDARKASPAVCTDPAAPTAVSLQSRRDRLLGLRYVEAVQVVGVHQDAVAGVSLLRHVAAGNHLEHRQPELRREFPVPLVVCRHRHDGTGAVAEQDIVGDKDRNLLAASRIRGVATQEYTGLRLALLALQIRFRCDGTPIGIDGLRRGGRTTGPARIDPIRPLLRGQSANQVVFGASTR